MINKYYSENNNIEKQEKIKNKVQKKINYLKKNNANSIKILQFRVSPRIENLIDQIISSPEDLEPFKNKKNAGDWTLDGKKNNRL